MVERVYDPGPSFTITAAMPDRIAEIGPRARPRQRPEADPFEWRELALVAALAMLLGFANGAIAVVGTSEASSPDASVVEDMETGAAGSLESDALRGSLWRPEGSIAVRPLRDLQPVLWQPHGANVETTGPLAARTVERVPARN